MITLISPPGFKSFSGLQTHDPNPSLGLAYIAGALKAAGLSYTVIDAAGSALDQIRTYTPRPDFMVQGLLPEEIAHRLPRETRIVGITCLFSSLWPIVREIARIVRQARPGVLLVLGGEHGTAVPEYSLRDSVFDVIVLGEGEVTAVELFRRHLGGQSYTDLPGIAYLDAESRFVATGLSPRQREIDEIALPDWDSFPIEEYIGKNQQNGLNMGRSMPILATRGCPYECTFCSNPTMWTKRYVMRSAGKVVDEIELYVRKYHVSNVDLQDLTAVVNRHWALEFSQELIKRGVNVTWQMPSGTRSEVFDAEVSDLLYRSGCRALSFAPETGSPELLELTKKRVDLERMLQAMRIAVRRGFSLSCFLVIGFPGETRETLNATLRLVRRMAVLGIHEISIGKFVPYPGSALFRRALADGQVQLDDNFFITPMDMFSKKAPSFCDLPAAKLYRWMIWLYANFFFISFALRPFRSLRILLKAVLTGREETRYAKWLVDRLHTRRRWRRMASST